jgi:hypothetical protein
VLDLYPLVPPDPLVALLELNGQLAVPAARGGGAPPVRSVVRLTRREALPVADTR